MRPLLILGLVAVTLSPLAAQEQDPIDELAGKPEGFQMSRMPEGFGGGPMARVAWRAIRNGEYVRAREAARRLLQEDPKSIPGHCVLGLVQHHGEGNLAIALYFLERCRELFEARYGPAPTPDDPWLWHSLAISQAAYVNGEMGRHEGKLRLLLERDALYPPERPADRGWPLMRLRRFDAARKTVAEAYATGVPEQIMEAKTVLCAIEAEQRRRRASYEACVAAAEFDRQYGIRDPVAFTNAAEAALGVLETDQAEEWIRAATERFRTPTVANPWLDLANLYVAEGRLPEALDAVRKMFEWRRRQPPAMDEQNRAEAEMTSALFLIVAGHPQAAARIVGRALERPDRTGFTSSQSEQMDAALALADRLANRAVAELLAEEASWSDLSDALGFRAAAWQRRWRAWSSGRRAAALLEDERMLDSTLRPYLAGSIEIPEWAEPEIAALAGTGIVQAALREARRREDLEGSEGYFLAYDAEIAFRRRRWAEALSFAEDALAALPAAEVLLQGRMAGLGAGAAHRLGDIRRAVELYDRAMQIDPGTIRRLGLALPTRFVASQGQVAERALGYLRRSPRFDEAVAGFTVRVTQTGNDAEAMLLGAGNSVLARVQVTPSAGEDARALARRLASELHAAAFAPRLDLTQADIQSLDGAPTVGADRSTARLESVLSEIFGTRPEAAAGGLVRDP